MQKEVFSHLRRIIINPDPGRQGGVLLAQKHPFVHPSPHGIININDTFRRPCALGLPEMKKRVIPENVKKCSGIFPFPLRIRPNPGLSRTVFSVPFPLPDSETGGCREVQTQGLYPLNNTFMSKRSRTATTLRLVIPQRSDGRRENCLRRVALSLLYTLGML